MSLAADATLPTVDEPARALAAAALVARSRDRTLLVGLALAGLSGVSGIDVTADHSGARTVFALSFAVVLPVIFLVGGLRASAMYRDVRLLFGVPCAVGVAAMFRPSVPIDPIVFALTLVVLIAYLVVAARHLQSPASPDAELLPRTAEPDSPRIRRRLRLYRVLQLAAALAFALPLAVAIGQIANGGASQPLLLVAAAGMLGALACRAFLIDALERHLQRDPALSRSLSRLRRHARKGRPAPLFYVAAGLALTGMVLFASRHVLGGDGTDAPAEASATGAP